MDTRPLVFPSVADTEAGPELQWALGDLFVRFRDWKDEPHEVQFIDVPHFEFLGEGELDTAVFACDGALEVIDSPLIARLVNVGEICEAEADAYRHLVIGFNEIGSFLVVVCSDLNLSSGNGRRAPSQ